TREGGSETPGTRANAKVDTVDRPFGNLSRIGVMAKVPDAPSTLSTHRKGSTRLPQNTPMDLNTYTRARGYFPDPLSWDGEFLLESQVLFGGVEHLGGIPHLH